MTGCILSKSHRLRLVAFLCAGEAVLCDDGRMQSNVSVVMVSYPERAVALEAARALVAEKLVACAQVQAPMTSVYVWEGEVCEDVEVLVLLKTDSACVARLMPRVVALHPYEVPEVVVLDAADALKAYGRWVGEMMGTSVRAKVDSEEG